MELQDHAGHCRLLILARIAKDVSRACHLAIGAGKHMSKITSAAANMSLLPSGAPAGTRPTTAPEADAWAGAWSLPVEIAWGDCDDAGIVFYPQFFRWMDTAFHRWLRALGTSHRDVVSRFGVIGLPIVDAGAQFRLAVSYDETLIVAVRVVEWQPRRFRLGYRGTKPDGAVVFEGHEVRAFAARDAATGRLKGVDIASEFKQLLG